MEKNLIKYLKSLGKKEYIKKNYSLNNLQLALNFLSNPQDKIKNIIHITGTNGKGSVAIYTSLILSSLGYSTGLYISPHIYDITERIQINNKPISYSLLEKYLKNIYQNLPKDLFFSLTYFEILTCIMFLYFSEKQLEFVILEVGLGGKLDATNIIEKSTISCITSISLDHTEVLGNTEFKILKDKSGIIKENSLFICGKIEEKYKKFLKSLCKDLDTRFVYVGNSIKDIKLDFNLWTTSFRYKDFLFTIPTCSFVQPYNLLFSIKIVEELHKLGYVKEINYEEISEKLKKFVIPLRMQKLKFKNLELIVDGAHNPSAIKNFVSTIKKSPWKDIVICFTMMKDKDYKSCLKILSKLKEKLEFFIVFKLNLKRAQSLKILYNEAKRYFKTLKFNSIDNLLNYLRNFCKNKKIIFVGSFYISEVFKGYGRKFV
jgi:dihydrofolate synthase/folylpolyglutamate synthase